MALNRSLVVLYSAGGCLYAGLCQKLEFEFYFGSKGMTESTATIETSISESNNDVEFWVCYNCIYQLYLYLFVFQIFSIKIRL